MKRKPLRRVYIMDCGKFIKIGISTDAERRRTQIPYDVLRYYCTEPLKNASDIERYMHDLYKPVRCERAKGTEYFNADFNVACKILETSLSVDQSKRNQAVMAVLKLSSDKNYEFDTHFYNALNETMKMPDCVLELISCFAFDMIAPKKQKVEVYENADYIKIPNNFIESVCIKKPHMLQVLVYILLRANEDDDEYFPKGYTEVDTTIISLVFSISEEYAEHILDWLCKNNYIVKEEKSVYKVKMLDTFLP